MVLRGARRSGAPASTSQAAAALDASLLQEGEGRAPYGLPYVHRCLVEAIQQAAAALDASLLQEGEGRTPSGLPCVHRCLVEAIQQAAAALDASVLQEGEGHTLAALAETVRNALGASLGPAVQAGGRRTLHTASPRGSPWFACFIFCMHGAS